MRVFELLDKSFKRLAFIDNSLEKGIHYVSDSLSSSVSSGIYTLDMDIPKDTEQTRYIEEGNYITFINNEEKRVLLTIMRVVENANDLSIYCEDTTINLINKITMPIEKPSTPQPIEWYINQWFVDTGWKIGINESTKKASLEFKNNNALLKNVQDIVKLFDVNFYFETHLNPGTNPIFTLNIVKRRTDGQGFRISTDDYVDGIEREINLDNVVTRLIVKGAQLKDGQSSSGSSNSKTPVSNTITQPNAGSYFASKSEAATSPITISGYSESQVNTFRIDQADPRHVTGAYIDDFLKRGYPDSPIIGYGKDVKELSDYYGISAAAFLGVAAKETVFGRSASGGRYNFTGITSGSGTMFDSMLPKKYAVDRYWIDPQSVRDGIAAFFHLARYGYADKGYVQYDKFVERWAPSFENDHSSVKSLFWGVITAFGYDFADKTYKKNYSKSSDNITTLNLSANKQGNSGSSNKVTTQHNQMLEKMIKWFQDRKGKVRYSMSSRSGPNSYDCSSAVYSALFYAGFKPNINWLGSTVSLWGDIGSNKLMVEIPRNQARRGDIFLSGARGAASAGASGHTGVFLDNNTIIHCNYAHNGISQTPVSGHSGTPIYCFRLNDKTSGSVTSSDAASSKTEAAVQRALAQVGGRYVWGGTAFKANDCSGLVYEAYRHAGFAINHRCTTTTIAQQKSPFKKISSSEARRGDLVIQYNGGHVAILLGSPNSGAGIVHAATPELGIIKQTSINSVVAYYRVVG